MTTQMRPTGASEVPAELVGVPITEPDAEILVKVESALAKVPAPEDWNPGPVAATG